MKKFLFLFLLLAGAHFTPQAQTLGLFLDEPRADNALRCASGSPGTTVTFTYRQKSGVGTGDIAFATSASGTYSDPLTFSMTMDGTGNGCQQIYVKGTTIGYTEAEYRMHPTATYSTHMPYHVVTITALTMTAINQSALDTNPNTSGGKRVYPEGNAAGDNTVRRAVRISATISTPISVGVPIYFKSFDVDDPSAAGDAVDPDTGGAGTGLDNRGSNQNGVMQATGTTGSSNEVMTWTDPSTGIAEAELVVSMFPGDNYRVAASGNTAALADIRVDGINLEDSSNNTLPITKVMGTDMLTVWRTLHLEVDRMGTPPTSGNDGFNIVSAAYPASPQTWLTLYYNFANGQYQNGRINIGGGNYGVDYNYGDNPDYLFVNAELEPVFEYWEQEFTIVDDDDYNNNDSPNVGDMAESGPISDLGQMDNLTTTNLFAPAYYTVVNDGGGLIGNNNTTNFYWNASEQNMIDITNAKYGSWGNGADNFWVAYLVMGYQSAANKDNDPNSEPAELGTAATIVDTDGDIGAGCALVPEGGNLSFVFQETIRDFWADLGQTNDKLAAPHELGHQLGLPHRTGNYLMKDGNTNNTALHPNEIHILRCRVKAPGRP